MNVGKIAFKNMTKNMTLGFMALTGLTLAAGAALADDPTTMAPPIDGMSAPLSAGNAGVNASADSVFNWQEIPANQQVPLARATFDQGGYQLYDTVGETIVVPFTNQNLYVMKFAESPNGNLYFENEGGFPVLYVPKGGFLDNATVAGARWYPLGENFHPSEPVFLGIAPSYTDFVDLGWYPNTCFYGGYYGHTSFIEGGLFLPTIGLFFEIGGHPYYGWNSYHDYYREHPGFYHTGYYNRDFYHFAGNHYREYAPARHFGGFGGGDSRGFGGGRGGFNESRGGFSGRSGFGGGNGRTFRGAGNSGQGGRGYTVSRSGYPVNTGGGGRSYGESGGGRTFRGASNSGGGQSYGGGRSYSGGQSYGGGSSSSGGRSSGGNFGGNSNGASSGRSYGGGSGGYSGRSSGGSQSYGGGHSSGGQQSRTASNSGGGRSSGGSNSGGRGGDGERGGGRSR